MSGPGDPSGMCLSAGLRGVGMWLGFPVSSSPCCFSLGCLPPCWNVGRLGRFMVRISSSLSNKFQLEPEDSSHVGIEATRDGCRRG